jgi:dihydroorotate dehydrogenase
MDPRQTDWEGALRDLKAAGTDGVVLFQEPFQKDFDAVSRVWMETTIPAGPRHRLEVLEALSRLRPCTDLPLVAHGGFSTDEDVAKALALGAQWVQTG